MGPTVSLQGKHYKLKDVLSGLFDVLFNIVIRSLWCLNRIRISAYEVISQSLSGIDLTFSPQGRAGEGLGPAVSP